MPSLKEKGIALLGQITGVLMTTGTVTTLFTVPTGKVARILYVVIRDPSGSLAGATDIDFTNWRQTTDLSGMTGGATNYRIVVPEHNVSYVDLAAGTNFQITATVGAAGITVAVDVFGYLTN